MANVSITSDLEPYLASLRSYLADDNRRSPERDQNASATERSSAEAGQKKRTTQKDSKKSSSKERKPSRIH